MWLQGMANPIAKCWVQHLAQHLARHLAMGFATPWSHMGATLSCSVFTCHATVHTARPWSHTCATAESKLSHFYTGDDCWPVGC